MASHPIFVMARPAGALERDAALRTLGVTCSVLVHALALLFLLMGPWRQEIPQPPQEIAIEMVTLETPPPRPVPEPPPQALPPSPPPQLQEAPIAEVSRAPVTAPPAPRPSAPPERRQPAPVGRLEPGALLTPTTLPRPDTRAEETTLTVTRRQDGEPISRGEMPEVASQTVQHFILMQIARAWIIDLRSPRFRDLTITWAFVLQPDGMLEPPFGKNDPWDLSRMVSRETYAQMREPTDQGRYLNSVVTTFLQAIRQAQPFRVPPNEASYKNRALPLRFHAGDLVQGQQPSATR